MHLSHVLPVFAGLAAAAPAAEPQLNAQTFAAGPSGNEVQILGVAFAGTGCPPNSVAGQLSSDLTTLTLLYSSFVAESGKGKGSSDSRKNCQLNVKLKYPSGWQFSVFKADYRGYAQIPSGDTGTCKATYYFSGDSKQVSSTMTIKGPYDDNYVKTDQFGVESTVWSPCGLEGLLNINSEVRISPKDTSNAKSGQLTVTTLENIQVTWQPCTSQGDSEPITFPDLPEDEDPSYLPQLPQPEEP